MKLFKLPDLGEGLPDAVIREWYIAVGDTVTTDQPIVAMETAKALVDVPAPFDGKVEKLFGNVGDTIETGKPLIGFEGEGEEEIVKDAGTVVGAIQEGGADLEKKAKIAAESRAAQSTTKASPAIRALAKQLGVELSDVPFSGDRLTRADVQAYAENKSSKPAAKIDSEFQPLSQARKAMLVGMSNSHQQVVPVSIVDDADLHRWDKNQDFTMRLIRAMQTACVTEPMLNTSLNGENFTFRENKIINLGLAVDTPHGLFVPVIKDVANKSDQEIRENINQFKQHAKDKSFPREELQGATITLSNVGTIGGRYATPAIIPPMTAIVAFGKTRDAVVAFEGKMVIHPILPVSVTFDHRLITGGEAARFLKVLIETLEK